MSPQDELRISYFCLNQTTLSRVRRTSCESLVHFNKGIESCVKELLIGIYLSQEDELRIFCFISFVIEYNIISIISQKNEKNVIICHMIYMCVFVSTCFVFNINATILNLADIVMPQAQLASSLTTPCTNKTSPQSPNK